MACAWKLIWLLIFFVLFASRQKVINIQNSFVTNIASKINTTSPSLTVLDAFSSALNSLGENVFIYADSRNIEMYKSRKEM